MRLSYFIALADLRVAVVMSRGLGLLLVVLCCLWAPLQAQLGVPPETPPPPPEDFTSTTPFYFLPEEDYDNFDRVGSDYCETKEVCLTDNTNYQGFPARNCYCDAVCGVTGDCCPGFTPATTNIPELAGAVFECVRFEDAVQYPNYGITMVISCDASWPDNTVKHLCEERAGQNETILELPVTEPVHNIHFKNMYCSLCNYNYDYRFWNMAIKCNNLTGDCLPEFRQPDPAQLYRMCPLLDLRDRCYADPTSVASKTYKTDCENGSMSLVYAGFTMYKNKACALCDGIPGLEIRCEPDPQTAPTATQPIDPRKKYSFKMLVDFNSGHFTDNDGQTAPVVHSCKDNEMFDPLSNKCREILCPEPLQAKNGRCVNSSDSDRIGSSGEYVTNCTFTKLEKSEYEFRNNSKIYVFSSKMFYSESQYVLSGADVFVCLNHSCPQCETSKPMFTFDMIESYLSFITLIISMIALAVTFFTYIFFRELLNTPGKILVSLVLSLFLAQLMFLIAPQLEDSPDVCKAVAVIMHYFFLAAFCWMNIVALDLWMTFSGQFITPGAGSKSVRRFLRYSVYGWLVPLVIVAVALGVEYADIDRAHAGLKPGYGRGVCWITSRNALLLFFAGPLAAFKLFDIVAFVFTSVHIIRAKRQGAMARQKTSVCSFLINLKLSLVMGLTWVFAFLANLGGLDVLWILFIIFNCLQGFFIAISFLCTSKVKRLVRSKYEDLSKTKSSTQMTSLTPSNEQK